MIYEIRISSLSGLGRSSLNVAVGSDHRGVELKKDVIRLLAADRHGYRDFGTFSEESVDYPDIAREVAGAVAGGGFDRGILICYTGIGMCISANKVRGIRAALCKSNEAARLARLHNDANILCLGAMDVDEHVPEIAEIFLTTGFEGGRHLRRVNKIRAMEA
jgi:ribose 5-phosphate isomerase B